MISRRSVLKSRCGRLRRADDQPSADFPFLPRVKREYSARTVDLVRPLHGDRHAGPIDVGLQETVGLGSRSGPVPASRFSPAERFGDYGVLSRGRIHNRGHLHGVIERHPGWNAFIAAHGQQFQRVEGVADFKQAKALGKIGILIGQQNSAHFRTVEDVDRFYNLGQRVSQLTYSGNRIGGGSSDPRDSGLSKYGAADRGAHE